MARGDYNSTMGTAPFPPEVIETPGEATPNLDQATLIPGPPNDLVDNLIGEANPLGHPVIRVVHG